MMQEAKTIKDYPDKEHYAIVEFHSIYVFGTPSSHVPGDYGTPSVTHEVTKYFYSYDVDVWKAKVECLAKSTQSFKAFYVSGIASYKMDINVNMKQ